MHKWVKGVYFCKCDKHRNPMSCSVCDLRSGPEVIKRFSCSTQLCTKYILFIDVKMPTIVDIYKIRGLKLFLSDLGLGKCTLCFEITKF